VQHGALPVIRLKAHGNCAPSQKAMDVYPSKSLRDGIPAIRVVWPEEWSGRVQPGSLPRTCYSIRFVCYFGYVVRFRPIATLRFQKAKSRL
jgi:hypothetical protein